MATTIDCGLDNGRAGDARVALVLRPERECFVGATESRLALALDTNGGPCGIDVSRQDHVAMACDELGCSLAELRAAAVAAYPGADAWDWCAECAEDE